MSRHPVQAFFAALLCTLLLAACGTSSQVTRPYAAASGETFAYAIDNPGGMTAEDLTTLRQALDRLLAASGALAADGAGASRKVNIRIHEYRMRHGASRALVGIMAGKDTIRSTVEVRDAGGRLLGSSEVDSGNATAWGTTGGLIEGHAEEIVGFLRGSAAGG
jgi:hypothetical protein